VRRWLFPDDLAVDDLALLVDLVEHDRVPPLLTPPGVRLAGLIDPPPGELTTRRIMRVHGRGDLPLVDEADAIKITDAAAFDLLLLGEARQSGKPVCLDVSHLALKDLVRALAALGPGVPVCLMHTLDIVGAVKRLSAFGTRFDLPIGYILRGPMDDALLDRAVGSMGGQDFTLLQLPPALDEYVAAYVPGLIARLSSLREETGAHRPAAVAARAIAPGEILEGATLRYAARQTHSTYPAPLDVIQGKAAKRAIEQGEPIQLSDVDLHVAGLIQVRTQSSRLPGKAVMPLGSLGALEHVIDRAKRAEMLDSVIICTTDQPEDDSLVPIGEKWKIPTFRGSEMNVLKRFLGAADEFGADVMVRITGDSPLVAVEAIDGAVEHHLSMNADYTSCTGLPVGTALEVFNTAAMRLAYTLSEDPETSEDLSFYLRRPEVFNVTRWEPPRELHAPELVMALNRPEDAEVLKAIFEALDVPGGPPFSTAAAIDWLRAHPEVAAINRDYTPKPTVCNTRFVFRHLRSG
jgi:spore coat polysaccharide biosynthesis protein SpsF